MKDYVGICRYASADFKMFIELVWPELKKDGEVRVALPLAEPEGLQTILLASPRPAERCFAIEKG